jgi:dipeptidyl aminopeptidase/acylaminoacyl peptidase
MFLNNTKIALTLAAILGSLGNGYSGIVLAQQFSALPAEAVLRTRHLDYLSSVEFSPDGQLLAYVVRRDENKKNISVGEMFRSGIFDSGADIEVLKTNTGERRTLTGGKGENWLPKWSPDGRFLAFVSDRDGSGHARLWVWDRSADALHEVSQVSVLTWQTIEWTSDSKSVFLTVLPNGSSLDSPIETTESQTEGEKTAKNQEQVPTIHLFRSNAIEQSNNGTPASDPWNLNRMLRDLIRVDILTGYATTVLHNERIETYRPSPDGSRIAYTISKRFEKPGSQQTLFDLKVVEIAATHQQRVVASDIRLRYDGAQFSWSPNGALISYFTADSERGTVADCYIVSATGGSPRNITRLSPLPQPDLVAPSIPVWDRTGSYIYFVRDGALWQTSVKLDDTSQVARIVGHNIRGWLTPQSNNLLWLFDDGRSTIVVAHDNLHKQDAFYKVDLKNGESRKLLEQGQCYTCGIPYHPFAITHDGQEIAYLAEDAQHDSDLWVSDTEFRHPRRLTHLNPQFEQYQLGSARLIDWLSDDGERLHGALLLPSDYRVGKQYPLVVWVYGGGLSSNSLDHFGLIPLSPVNGQLLATRGYAVLLPDSPQHEGTAMADLVKTVLSGVNKVIEMGIADPERVGVMGHSNGGYSTLALIVQTKRFKAAVEMEGTADLVGLYSEMGQDGTAYGTALLEHGQDAMGGSPWLFRERYIENSPLFYLDRVETPLLIEQATGDPIVPRFHGDQVFVSLRRLGKEVEYATYDDEGHIPGSYANRLDLLNRMLAWFDRYLESKDH